VITLLQLDVPFEGESPTWTTVTVPPQLSDAVTEAMLGAGTAEKHWTATAPGQVIDGGVVSTNVMCWTHEEWFPHASVAVHVRLIPVPAQLVVPGASAKVTSTVPAQLSVAVAVPVFAGAVDAPHGSWASPGQVIEGGVVSLTVIVWVQLAWLPHASTAW
jgi:hypothetical protein